MNVLPMATLTPALALALALTLSGCASPPEPPQPDESKRRPANSASEIGLQVCQSELQNTRIVLGELGQASAANALALRRMAMRAQQPVRCEAPAATPAPPPSNGVYVVHFAFGSARPDLPPSLAAAIVAEAREAPRVLLSGRTDGTTDDPSETRIARERAEAVRQHLVAAGVPASRIRTTWQPSGDHATDNSSPAGRAANRRVEIEIYRALPVMLNPSLSPGH